MMLVVWSTTPHFVLLLLPFVLSSSSAFLRLLSPNPVSIAITTTTRTRWNNQWWYHRPPLWSGGGGGFACQDSEDKLEDHLTANNHNEPRIAGNLEQQQQGLELHKREAFISAMERRSFARSLVVASIAAMSSSSSLTTTTTTTTTGTVGGIGVYGKPEVSWAAPPIAIIAEELGYFPVTNSRNETVYIPKRVQRSSSEQALALAQALNNQGAVLYTAYWCPHCARQKELLGQQAWQMLRTVECAPKGYKAEPALCLTKQIDSFPTWILRDGRRISGERSLLELAQIIGFDKSNNFDESLEQNVPPPLGSSSCR